MKTCIDCHVLLMGRGPQAKRCKPCAAVAWKAQAKSWIENNRERYLSLLKDWNRRNPIVRAPTEATRQYQREFQREWRKRNPDEARDRERRSRIKNLASRRIADRANAHNRRQAPGVLTKADAAAILSHPCAYCGAPSEHIEHCTPLSRGGWNTVDNCVAACASCNLSKGRKTVLEFFGLWP